jgi:RNA polymerase sigma factor (sigma-70 family)
VAPIVPAETLTEVDSAFAEACRGNPAAFACWIGLVEVPLRLSMRRFLQAVDIEAVLQETLLRMWIYAQERGHELEGESASLKYAIGMARNLARAEARRTRREASIPTEDLPEIPIPPEAHSDPELRRAILECLAKVAARPLRALRARIDFGGYRSDREIASGIGMTLNTFLQNIVRARKQIASCLERRGVSLREVLA